MGSVLFSSISSLIFILKSRLWPEIQQSRNRTDQNAELLGKAIGKCTYPPGSTRNRGALWVSRASTNTLFLHRAQRFPTSTHVVFNCRVPSPLLSLTHPKTSRSLSLVSLNGEVLFFLFVPCLASFPASLHAAFDYRISSIFFLPDTCSNQIPKPTVLVSWS